MRNCDQPKTLCIDCPFHKEIVQTDDQDLSIYELEQPIDFACDTDDSEADFISNIRDEITLQDHLITLMRAVVPPEQWEIGEYIISNINESGYLEGSVEEFSIDLNTSIEEIEAGPRDYPDIRSARNRRERPAGVPQDPVGKTGRGRTRQLDCACDSERITGRRCSAARSEESRAG